MSKKTNSQEEFTEEQVAEMRKNALENMTHEIEYLEVESKYYNLLAEVEEAKLRQFHAMVKHSQLYASTQPNEEPAAKEKELHTT